MVRRSLARLGATALCPVVARSRAGLRMPVAVSRGTNTAAAHRRAAGRAVDTRATRSRVATRTPATCLVAPLAWGPTPLAGPAYPVVPAGVTRSSSRVHTRAARRLRRTASREYRRGRPAPNPSSRGAWACSPGPRRAHSRPLAGAGEWPCRSARRCVQHCVQRPVRRSFRPLPARVRNCRRRGATIAPPTPNFPAKPARSLVGTAAGLSPGWRVLQRRSRPHSRDPDRPAAFAGPRSAVSPTPGAPTGMGIRPPAIAPSRATAYGRDGGVACTTNGRTPSGPNRRPSTATRVTGPRAPNWPRGTTVQAPQGSWRL